MAKGRLLFLVCAACFLLTGCWDRKDPEDRAFIITVGVDTAEAGYHFTFAPANMEEEEGEPYTVDAATLAEAVVQADCRSSRKTDLGQLKTVILGKGVLEEERRLTHFLGELEHNQIVSEQVMLLATEGQAADCVNAVLEEDSQTGLFLWDFYKNTAKEVAVTKSLDLDTFLTEWQEQNGAAVLPRIAVEEEKLRLGGGIGIANGQMYGLDEKQEQGYLFLLGEADGALLEGTYQGEKVPVEIRKSGVRYDFVQRADGIGCRVTLPLEGILQGGMQAEENLENLFETIIKQEIENTIGIAKAAGTDLFGILPRLSRQVPRLVQGQERDTLWENMTVEIQPQVKLRDIGAKKTGFIQ